VPGKKHPHRYEHVETPIGFVWRCSLPECAHYMPQHMESFLMPGRRVMCNECSNTFILTPVKMQSIQPICDACETERLMRRRERELVSQTKSDSIKSDEANTEILEALLKEIGER